MIGKTLNNRFKVTGQVGTGAMGEVFRATDLQTNQEVALKVMARHLTFDPDMLERFRREGEALKQLRHPNIVSFVDMFEFEGQQVIVMEYVPGGSLFQLIRRGPLPVNQARHIALDLCDALTRAHRLNIIHRDIKPENILLAQDGTPRLTDLGVARLVSEGTRLTGTGTQLGTPYYMSPEAWQGQHLDAQTDIWSLGVVLYEMLGGQVPFGGETMVAVMNKVLTAPLPDLRALRPDVPDGMVKIIRKMLTRDKAKRYASMRLVGADLEQVVLPSPTMPPSPVTQPGTALKVERPIEAPPAKPSKSLWLGLGLGAVAMAVLCVAVVLGGFGLAAMRNRPTAQAAATQTAIWSHGMATQTSQVGGGQVEATATLSIPSEAPGRPPTQPMPTETPPPPTVAPPTFTPAPLQTLVVCMDAEPTSLYLYGDESAAAETVRQALTDGPIDLAGGQYQPVLLTKLPSRENGDLEILSKTVKAGDQVSDAYGYITTLSSGLQLISPAGDVFTYSGGNAVVAQLRATFHLRDDVRWADGQPLTAADSVFSYNLAKSPDTPGGKSLTVVTVDYTAVDDHTLTWTGLPGYWSAYAALNFFSPLPQHKYSSLSAGQMVNSSDVNQYPLSWGPFVVDLWLKGDRLDLRPNPQYYRAAEGLPRAGAISFRFIPDPAAALDALAAGQCHVLLSFGEYPMVQQGPRLRQLIAQQNLSLQTALISYENLYFGIQPDPNYKRPAGNDLFADVRVRQGVAYCIDRQALIDQAYGGFGTPPDSYFAASDPRHAAGLPSYAFDPVKGKELLNAAGWSDTNGDGILDKGGRKFSVTYYSTQAALRQAVGPLVADMLKKNCQIDVKLSLLTFDELLGSEGTVVTRKFDLAEFAWVFAAGPAEHACGVHMPAQGQDHTGYDDPQFDAACLQETLLLDLNPSPTPYFEAQRILAQDLPALVLFHRIRIGVARPEVRDFYLNGSNQELQNIETLNVAP